MSKKDDDQEWEELKLRIAGLENELDVAAMIIQGFTTRLNNIELSLGFVLADLYPNLFCRCKHCNNTFETKKVKEHELLCPSNPDNVYH